jgi:hypothetical protein
MPRQKTLANGTASIEMGEGLPRFAPSGERLIWDDVALSIGVIGKGPFTFRRNHSIGSVSPTACALAERGAKHLSGDAIGSDALVTQPCRFRGLCRSTFTNATLSTRPVNST